MEVFRSLRRGAGCGDGLDALESSVLAGASLLARFVSHHSWWDMESLWLCPSPLIEVEFTTWRRATNKELPSPCLGEQCFHAASMEETKRSRPALDLLQDPALGRERSWSCPDAVQEVRADTTPGLSKTKRQVVGLGHSSDQGKRDAERSVGDGRQRCAERSPAGRGGRGGTGEGVSKHKPKHHVHTLPFKEQP